MNEMTFTLRRGFDVVVRAAGPLLAGGLIWWGANVLTRWLLVGPALHGLFRIALRAHRGESVDWRDNFSAVEDPTASLVAGWILVLPFMAWGLVDRLGESMESALFSRAADQVPGVPVVASLALFIHFGIHVFVFAFLSERRCGLVEAFRASHEMADRPGPAGSRWSGLGRQLVFTSALLCVFLVMGSARGLGVFGVSLLTVLAGPFTVAMLAAWHAQRSDPQPLPARAPDVEPTIDDDFP